MSDEPPKGSFSAAAKGRPHRGAGLMASLIVASLTGAAVTPAWPHHSYAMFDRTKDLSLHGTVKDWQWTNPHTWMVLMVSGPQGETVEWNLEGQSTQVLRMLGWNREMVKPGDEVTVHINPLRSGGNGGQIAGVVAADGHVYGRPPLPK